MLNFPRVFKCECKSERCALASNDEQMKGEVSHVSRCSALCFAFVGYEIRDMKNSRRPVFVRINSLDYINVLDVRTAPVRWLFYSTSV